jgi:hypothetical protein
LLDGEQQVHRITPADNLDRQIRSAEPMGSAVHGRRGIAEHEEVGDAKVAGPVLLAVTDIRAGQGFTLAPPIDNGPQDGREFRGKFLVFVVRHRRQHVHTVPDLVVPIQSLGPAIGDQPGRHEFVVNHQGHGNIIRIGWYSRAASRTPSTIRVIVNHPTVELNRIAVVLVVSLLHRLPGHSDAGRCVSIVARRASFEVAHFGESPVAQRMAGGRASIGQSHAIPHPGGF